MRYFSTSGSFRFIPTKRNPQTKSTCNIINVVNLLGQKLAEREEVSAFVDQPLSLQLEYGGNTKGNSVVIIVS